MGIFGSFPAGNRKRANSVSAKNKDFNKLFEFSRTERPLRSLDEFD